jgi:hypothetical protein
LRLTDPERSTLAEIGKRLGRKALKTSRCGQARHDPDWYRRLIAKKFDGSRSRSYPGRPRIRREVIDVILQMATENSGWGYDRIVGALANLGHVVSDQTVGNVLRRYGIAPAPKRRQGTTWKDFIAVQWPFSQESICSPLKCSLGAASPTLRLILHPSGDPACDPSAASRNIQPKSGYCRSVATQPSIGPRFTPVWIRIRIPIQ